jgi:hypothetical protein
MSLSEAVREAVPALLGKNWHQASDDEVARITRWVQIKVAPVGAGRIDAAALRAALSKESPAVGAPRASAAEPGGEGPERPPTKTKAFRRWAAETYPAGIPAGTSAKQLARQCKGNIEISERQIRRAFRDK